jgi:hypothetical protein
VLDKATEGKELAAKRTAKLEKLRTLSYADAK